MLNWGCSYLFLLGSKNVDIDNKSRILNKASTRIWGTFEDDRVCQLNWLWESKISNHERTTYFMDLPFILFLIVVCPTETIFNIHCFITKHIVSNNYNFLGSKNILTISKFSYPPILSFSINKLHPYLLSKIYLEEN